jgi:Cytidylate kinase-like family
MTVIAMTREIGSHGTEVAAGVANELDLKVVSSEIVASHVDSGLGVSEEAVQRYLKGSASILEKWRIDKKKFSRLTADEVLGIAQQGNVFIRGWGGGSLVSGCAAGAQRPRLCADGRSRSGADGPVRRQGFSPDQAGAGGTVGDRRNDGSRC